MESYKKGVLISANVFYFFIFLGFVFFTHPNPTFFHKYSLANVLGLVALLLLAIPYNFGVRFLLNTELYLKKGKKLYRINLIYRLLLVIFIIVVALLGFELAMRMMPKPLVENFHPFLQAINTKKNNEAWHVNSDNFRYDEITKEKPDSVYRIFITGGSTVFDEWHPYETSLPKLVENLLRKKYPDKKIEVINAGYNRYTSEHTLILYQTKLADYHPDLIVVWQGFNDMYYSCTPEYLTMGSYKADYSHFYNVMANVINSYFNYKFQLYSVTFINRMFSEKFYADLKGYLPSSPSRDQRQYAAFAFPSLQAFSRNMNYLVKAVKSDDVSILVGNQPNYYLKNGKGSYGLAQAYCTQNGKTASPESLRIAMEQFNQESKKIAENNDVAFVDLAASVPKVKGYFTDDVHYTDKGNEKVANALYTAIVANEFIE